METPPQLDDERIFPFPAHPLQDRLLRQRMLQLLVRQDVSLGDRLESVQIARLFVLDEQDFASTTFTQDAHHLEIIERHFLLRCRGLLDALLGLVLGHDGGRVASIVGSGRTSLGISRHISTFRNARIAIHQLDSRVLEPPRSLVGVGALAS